MANIGTFTQADGAFSGVITTLALKAKATIQPITKHSDHAPDYRIFAGGAEIGAAWTRTGKDERDYLSVKLDDPSFAGAIYCRLIAKDGRYQLIWSR